MQSAGVRRDPGGEPARRFRVSTSGRVGPRRWWQVVVHPGAAELREAAYRYRPWNGRGFYAEVVGVCQPATYWVNQETGEREWRSSGYAGVIRFVDGAPGEIITHELVHAAATTYRMNVARDIRLGEQCRRREEDFAYIYGELYQSFEDRYMSLQQA